MREIWLNIWAGATEATWLEQIATVLGLLGVWLALIESLWNFPVGLIQVALFGWVCWQGRLYSETILQAWFFVALLYGWWHWSCGGVQAQPLAVQKLTSRERLAWLAAVGVLWLVWSSAMAQWTSAALPFWDGAVFALSVVAQWLQARKALENWVGWLLANTLAVGVFAVKQYYWFAVLYFLFWLLAWGGLRAWQRSWRRAHA